MININTEQDQGKSPTSRKSSYDPGPQFKGTSLARVNEENASPLEVRHQVRAQLTDDNHSLL